MGLGVEGDALFVGAARFWGGCDHVAFESEVVGALDIGEFAKVHAVGAAEDAASRLAHIVLDFF